MSTNSKTIIMFDITVEIVRKHIKNIHFRVYPPEGRVRITVPKQITDEGVRLAVLSRLSWIKRKQEVFRKQPRQVAYEYVSGESHFFQGRRYILDVVEVHGRHAVRLKNDTTSLLLQITPGTTKDRRALVIDNWYRDRLKQTIPDLLEKWQPVIGRQVKDWGVKKMKTRWGSCNTRAARIWLNLELAKKPAECLEYVLVHELVHLHERYHNDNFKRLMNHYLPQWRQSQAILNSSGLWHED